MDLRCPYFPKACQCRLCRHCGCREHSKEHVTHHHKFMPRAGRRSKKEEETPKYIFETDEPVVKPTRFEMNVRIARGELHRGAHREDVHRRYGKFVLEDALKPAPLN